MTSSSVLPLASPTASDLERLAPLSDQLTAAYLENHGLLPIDLHDGVVRVATWHESVDPQALDDLGLLFGKDVVLVPAEAERLRATIRRVYGAEGVTAESLIATLQEDGNGAGRPAELALDDLVSMANEAPVVRLVNLLLLEALDARASDVHLEGGRQGVRVRYRIDGVLQEAPGPPEHLAAAVVSRLKIMADLDVAERRVPQDGRIQLVLQSRNVDVRVSTLPTLHGESVVLRLLDQGKGWGSLEESGMGTATLARFRQAIAKPNGIILATGPTGSGKTTTLYAVVDAIRTGREKILTVEDPVEYELEGVPQVPVREKVGLTFATALRALLRQDPDVLLVGEIRDPETAEIATQAALTGHLVLSTLHTNDAPGALTRLLELEVPAFLVASTVEAVLAQRLVRTVCRSCVSERAPTESELLALGVSSEGLRSVPEPVGCPACRGTGFRGRTGLFELLAMGDELRAAVLSQERASRLRALAVEGGMGTLLEDGVAKIRAGVTTVEEVVKVAGAITSPAIRGRVDTLST